MAARLALAADVDEGEREERVDRIVEVVGRALPLGGEQGDAFRCLPRSVEAMLNRTVGRVGEDAPVKLPSFGRGLLKVPAITVSTCVTCDHVMLGTKLIELPKTVRESHYRMTRNCHSRKG